jgi:hypothetical protein
MHVSGYLIISICIYKHTIVVGSVILRCTGRSSMHHGALQCTGSYVGKKIKHKSSVGHTVGCIMTEVFYDIGVRLGPK